MFRYTCTVMYFPNHNMSRLSALLEGVFKDTPCLSLYVMRIETGYLWLVLQRIFCDRDVINAMKEFFVGQRSRSMSLVYLIDLIERYFQKENNIVSDMSIICQLVHRYRQLKHFTNVSQRSRSMAHFDVCMVERSYKYACQITMSYDQIVQKS